MPEPRSSAPRVPSGGRNQIGRSDLIIMQRAKVLIDELGADLDRQLSSETRPAERLRLLRETTNRITRTANDAIHAYTRARRAVDAQLERADGNSAEASATRDRLRAARLDLLRALEAAARRYP